MIAKRNLWMRENIYEGEGETGKGKKNRDYRGGKTRKNKEESTETWEKSMQGEEEIVKGKKGSERK